ncbi:MAG: hypothetical protein BMS9Abin28_1576 [Anaerolineae bacterium]|nr:MAG: hypothetical protein BMS9Abin28_1576 [Anaerolineae bacterium]
MFYDHARRERGLLLGLIAVSLLAVTVLASGLSSVEVQTSRQLTLEAVRQIADLADLPLSGPVLSALSFLAGFFRLLILVLLPFSIYYLVTSPNLRKRVLVQVLYLLGFAYMLLALSKTLGQVPNTVTAEQPSVGPATPANPGIISSIVEAPGWLFVIASAAITILLAALAIQVYRRFLRAEEPAHSAAAEARWALGALDRGVNLENVIFQAYHRLCATSSDRLGLPRQRDMTPMEYERVLAKSGVPVPPLARLTRLFEKARYGSAVLSTEDEKEAVAALRQILSEES